MLLGFRKNGRPIYLIQGGSVDASITPVGTEGQDPPAETALSEEAQGFLKDIPELERPIVEKYVKTWDAGVTKRFQDVHSEYADFKPLKEAGLTKEDIDQSVALVAALNENPQEVLKILADSYGVKFATEVAAAITEQGASVAPVTTNLVPQTAPVGQAQDPGLTEIVNTMAQILLAQQNEAETKKQEALLDQELTGLKEKYKTNGDFNEQYVLQAAYSRDISLEEAVKEFYNFRDSLLKQSGGTPAPTVLGSNGGLPSDQIDFKKLDSKGTRNLVAQMLEASNRESQ